MTFAPPKGKRSIRLRRGFANAKRPRETPGRFVSWEQVGSDRVGLKAEPQCGARFGLGRFGLCFGRHRLDVFINLNGFHAKLQIEQVTQDPCQDCLHLCLLKFLTREKPLAFCLHYLCRIAALRADLRRIAE